MDHPGTSKMFVSVRVLLEKYRKKFMLMMHRECVRRRREAVLADNTIHARGGYLDDVELLNEREMMGRWPDVVAPPDSPVLEVRPLKPLEPMDVKRLSIRRSRRKRLSAANAESDATDNSQEAAAEMTLNSAVALAAPPSSCPLMAGFSLVANYSHCSSSTNPTTLQSGERRRRMCLTRVAGGGSFVRSPLFCPEPAADMNLEFVSECHRTCLLHVSSPNGERSPQFIFAGPGKKHVFAPSKAGCGHGVWTVEISIRDGTRWRLAAVERLELRGCGVRCYAVTQAPSLQLHDQAWLDFFH